MPMNYRWGCQDLKEHWKTALEDIVCKFKTGIEVRWGDHDLRTTKALLNRYYLEEFSEVRRSAAGHNYVQFLLKPSRKALALWSHR